MLVMSRCGVMGVNGPLSLLIGVCGGAPGRHGLFVGAGQQSAGGQAEKNSPKPIFYKNIHYPFDRLIGAQFLNILHIKAFLKSKKLDFS